MKSQIKNAETIMQVRSTLRFADLCRVQSKIYPSKRVGSKLSSARFLREAAIEKLESLGFKKDFLESIS